MTQKGLIGFLESSVSLIIEKDNILNYMVTPSNLKL